MKTVITLLKEDEELKLMWADLCNKQIEMELSLYVFDLIIRRYLLVCQKQFLKDTKSYLNVVKKKRHREQIKNKTEKHKPDETINMQIIEKDTTMNKEGSHLRLKLKCLENSIYFNTNAFKKNDIMKFCEAYKAIYTKQMKKEELATSLRK